MYVFPCLFLVYFVSCLGERCAAGWSSRPHVVVVFSKVYLVDDGTTALGSIGSSHSLVLHERTTLFNAPLQFSLSPQSWNPFPIDVHKVPKEFWVPTTELADNGGLLDWLLSLGERLVGDFGSVVLHDANHVPVVRIDR